MRFLLTCLAVLCCAQPLSAQFLAGQYELQLSGTAGSFTERVTIEGPTTEEMEQSLTYAYVALTPGYYILRGLSLEAELGLRAVEGYRPAQSALLNVSYTRTFRRSPVALFIRGGGGLANGIVHPVSLSSFDTGSDFDVVILHAGLGVKLRTGNSGYVRIELNYRDQRYEQRSDAYVTSRSIGTIALLFGVGTLL